MQHYVQIFFFAFVTGLSGALTPGPLLAFAVRSAARRGPSAGVLLVVGHGLIEASVVVAIFAGAKEFLQNQVTLRIIAGVGATALAIMGTLMLKDVRRLSLSRMMESVQKTGRFEHPVVGGFLLSLLNPTFPVWWATVGLALVTSFDATVSNISIFYAGHISSDFAWYVLVACAVGYGRRFVPDRLYRGFVVACALALMVFAVKFGWDALAGVGSPSLQAAPAP